MATSPHGRTSRGMATRPNKIGRNIRCGSRSQVKRYGLLDRDMVVSRRAAAAMPQWSVLQQPRLESANIATG